MIEDIAAYLAKLEHGFKELIIRQCKFCGFNKFLEENPDFEFPKVTQELLDTDRQSFISIPGLFGGFTYYLEEVNGKPVLYAEQSSRMDHSSDDYLYFEITENGGRMLEGEERETARERFRELDRKARERRLQELRARRENEK